MTPFIVAELSCNHLGSLARAMNIADAAAAAGADGFKVQVWSPDTMCIDPAYELTSGPWARRRLVDLYREAWLPWLWLPILFDHCRGLGMEPFGAAFDAPSVDRLCELGVMRLKIASYELVDLPLIRYMATKGKPMILSTGMATVPEIIEAYGAAQPVHDVTFLKCSSAYPASIADANLATIPDLARWLGCAVGLSDHSPGHAVAAAAAALGATMIEKHLTLRRADGGPDAAFSLEPAEFAEMVAACRAAAAARGVIHYGTGPSESTALRRSLYLIEDVACWQPLTPVNLGTARPALGLPPSRYHGLMGCKLKHSYKAGTPLTEDMLA